MLTIEIADCYRYATDVRERAKTADRAAKRYFLDMEQRWLSLAHSYELVARGSSIAET
jgi:hypothetical protein